MTTARSERRWFATAERDAAERTWGDEFVFHVASTGAIHLVSAAAGQTVLELRERPAGATAAELLAGDAGENPPDAAEIESLEQLLVQLESIGLTRSEPNA